MSFVAKVQRFEPVPYDKDNFSRWLTQLHQRAKRYGLDDVLSKTRTRPTALVQPTAPLPTANAAAVEA